MTESFFLFAALAAAATAPAVAPSPPAPQPARTIVSNPPKWVGAPGSFVDIPATNRPADAIPPLYKGFNEPEAHPFDLWGGGAWSDDLRGATFRSSGHTLDYNMQTALSAAFDARWEAITWRGTNTPSRLNKEPITSGTGVFADGTPLAPHSYRGLGMQSKADGGAPSLLAVFLAGSYQPNLIARLDLTQATGGYAMLVPPDKPIAFRGGATFSAGTYPNAVVWPGHGVFVGLEGNAVDNDFLVDFRGNATPHPPISGNYQFGSWVIDEARSLRIAVNGGETRYGQHFSLTIEELKTGQVHQVPISGVVPVTPGTDKTEPFRMSWAIWPQYDLLIGYDDSVDPPRILTIRPPAGDRLSQPWTSVAEKLMHDPKDVGGQATLAKTVNSLWGRGFVVPQLDGYAIFTRAQNKAQLVRPDFCKGVR